MRYSFFAFISLVIFVIESAKFELKEEPNLNKVLLGHPALLKCRLDIPENVVKIKLQWSKDMFGLENSTIQDVYKGRLFIPGDLRSGIYDLHFKSTEVNDDALYACHIELSFKDEENVESIIGKGSLSIIEPPKKVHFNIQRKNNSLPIIWQPQRSIVWGLQNDKLIFSCISNGGNPVPKLSWSVKSKTENHDLQNLEKQNFNVFDLSSETHNSSLFCHIENKKDYLDAVLPQAMINIHVLYFKNALIVRLNGKMEQPINTGEAVSFLCESVSTPGVPVYYSWFIEYNNPEKKSFEYLVEKSTLNSIVLKPSAKHHQSKLHCILQSSIIKDECDSNINKYCKIQLRQEIISNQSLNVFYSPKIKTPFENITINNIGEWISLSCEVDSNPSPSIKWFKTHVGTSKQSRSLNWYYQTSISNLIDLLTIDNIISSTSYHKFQIINEHDLDIYVCEVSVPNYQKVYKYVVVAREEEPTIKIDQPIIIVERDAPASLMCLIESWPKPTKSNIKWFHEASEVPIMSTERRYFITKRQLMGLESKLYFKRVISSDYGIYTCTISFGSTVVSKQIHLTAFKKKITIYIVIGLSGLFVIIIGVIIIICICKKNASKKKRKSMKAPLQSIMLPSPNIDSSMENEMFMNRLNSIPSYQKGSLLNEQIILPSNRCFIFSNPQEMTSKLSCSNSRNGQDEKSPTKGNERSWDSGVGPDDAVYRNGQMFQNPRGSTCISPFSTLASSNNSIGPINQSNMNNRYWQPYTPSEFINSQNPEINLARLNNTDNSNFDDSTRSTFFPSQKEGHVPLISTSSNQSFVCIPIEEYQQHMRILQDSQGPPSLRSFSIGSYSTNNGHSTFLPNYRSNNGNASPTEVSVKSNSTNSKI